MKEQDKTSMQQEAKAPSAYASVDKIVPKFCTTINIALLNNKNIALTMAYSENKEGNIAIIERVVIDLEHAKALNSVLTNLLMDVENESTNSQ